MSGDSPLTLYRKVLNPHVSDHKYSGMIAYLRRHGITKFKIQGDNLMICCPFHQERHPSCGVIVDMNGSGVYQCFTCEVRGSVRSLIKHLEGDITRTELQHLLQYVSVGAPIEKYLPKKEERLRTLAVKKRISEELVHDLDQYNIRCPYWAERGLSDETVSRYQLGWAPQKWVVTIPVRRMNDNALIGICFRHWDTHPQFPIELKTKIESKEVPRYYYTKGTDRNLSFFGCDQLREEDEEVYIFEGAIDAMNFWQRERLPVLARWGTVLTLPQLEFLKRFKRVHIIADNDKNEAGIKSAKRLRHQLRGCRVPTRILITAGEYKDYSDAVRGGVSRPSFTEYN